MDYRPSYMQSSQISTGKVAVWKVLENLKVHLSKAADDTPVDAAAICWAPRGDPRSLPPFFLPIRNKPDRQKFELLADRCGNE